jgi:hypothetical protein
MIDECITHQVLRYWLSPLVQDADRLEFRFALSRASSQAICPGLQYLCGARNVAVLRLQQSSFDGLLSVH